MKPYVPLGIRNRTLMEGYGMFESYLRPVPGTDCVILKAFDYGEKYAVRLCDETEDRRRIRGLMEREVADGKCTKEFFETIDRAYKDTVKDIRSWSETDFTKSSPEELISYFDRFYEIYLTTLHPMVLAIYASDLQELFERELKAALGEAATPEEVMRLTALLLTPTRLTTVQKEEQVLFEIQDEFEKAYPGGSEEDFESFANRDAIKARLETLSNELGWFHMEYLGEKRTSGEYRTQLLERVADLRKAGVPWKDQTSPSTRLAQIVAEQGAFFGAHPDAVLLRKTVYAMQEYLVVLDFSKADLVEGIYYARPLLEEMGKRVGLPSWIDVRFLTPVELREYLRIGRTVDGSYVADRKEHQACLLEDGVLTTYYGKDAKELADRIMEREEVSDAKEFKGLTAYPGVIRGIACVVTSAADREKFQTGQILVTVDTTTELTSIIKKSIAIVADQGGLLSHTAIVSREFKIPCLLRTKIGTKLVKDGDELEVDASAGIVRILS